MPGIRVRTFTTLLIVLFSATTSLHAQLVINEGSNRNYSTLADENGEYPDWIELYNTGVDTVNLFNYALSDNPSQPAKWRFPSIKLAPGGFLPVFCSGKDRKPVSGFVTVFSTNDFTPVAGWNNHAFQLPFYWDGVSDILVNTCSYNASQYTSNAVFRQTETPFYASLFTFQDGSNASCSAAYGTRVKQRPNMKLNGIQIGTGQLQNSPTDYPAPYGNWYWSARHQMLIQASELRAAGLSAGNIDRLAFDVVTTDASTWYDFFEIQLRLVSLSEVPLTFQTSDINQYQHTSFKIAEGGEMVMLYSPELTYLNSLYVDCDDLDLSTGRFPDGAAGTQLLWPATPMASNNNASTYSEYLQEPVFSAVSGFYNTLLPVYITNPNAAPAVVHYTTDGSDVSLQSPQYTGNPIIISQSTVLKAKAFAEGILPGKTAVSTYLFGVSHQTPILSVVTDEANLYGPTGIFDQWWVDWEKAAYVEFFDTAQNLIFSQRAGMQMDGGWGGARSHPQHSFRVELDDGVLGEGPVHYPLISAIPERSLYGKFYLRNGSNQYLILPYKEACQTAMMGKGTHNYYAAWEPVSVYINGSYFGLYDLREKMDTEYFEVWDGADDDQIHILSQSAWYGGVLRAVTGSVEAFDNDFQAFALLDPSASNYWEAASQYFDLDWYTDYIIGESWMGNTDWPWNNIKIVRSDKTNNSWRFCLMDMELALLPNAWTDCYADHIHYMLNYDPANKFINIWQRSLQNERFKHYFINRFADLMNTEYRIDHLLETENEMYDKMVAEMPNEFARWGDPNHVPEQMAAFAANHDVFQQQLSLRSTQVRNHLQQHFLLSNQVDVTLEVKPEGAGQIRISTVTPEVYPWQGIYFNGVPVRIEAMAFGSNAFKNWTPNGLIADTLNTVFEGLLQADAVVFEANFESVTGLPQSETKMPFVQIFPNPASTYLELTLHPAVEKAVNYRLVDAQGKQLLAGLLEKAELNHRVSLHELPAGVYVVQVTSGNRIYHQKFVKLH